ncbi:MAG: cysteine desulfurase [Alphaproteobacteria bacterium]|nr:cysteine desulfurase [Alphaproteobacteria bacterium]
MTTLRSVYCDYNAGAPIRPEAADALMRTLADGGNASSVHALGRRAKSRLETAREAVAAACGTRAQDIVFTSGATEALHLALEGARRAEPALRLIVSAIEHDAVAEAATLWPGAATAPVTPAGVVDLAALDALLAEGGPALVAVMLVNNETGAIQPIAEIARRVHAAGGVLLVDAAQAIGRIIMDAQRLGADAVALSSHKAGGPPGAGALALTPGFPFAPPRLGGGQERGFRPGTENTPAVAGFGAACAAATADLDTEAARLAGLRDAFEAGLLRHAPDAVIFAREAPRAPNVTLAAIPGQSAETGLIALDLAGVAASSGSACSSGKVRASRVLTAMGVAPALARCALRFSFGWASTEADVAAALAGVERLVVRRARQGSTP